MFTFQKVECGIWIGLSSKNIQQISSNQYTVSDSLSLPQSIHWMSILYTKLDSTSGSQGFYRRLYIQRRFGYTGCIWTLLWNYQSLNLPKNSCLVAPDLLKIVRVLSDVLAVSKLEIEERKKNIVLGLLYYIYEIISTYYLWMYGFQSQCLHTFPLHMNFVAVLSSVYVFKQSTLYIECILQQATLV